MRGRKQSCFRKIFGETRKPVGKKGIGRSAMLLLAAVTAAALLPAEASRAYGAERVTRSFYGDETTAARDYGSKALTGTELAIYQELKAAASRIASGETLSARVDITCGLGIESWVSEKTGDELRKEADEKFTAAIRTKRIVDCLIADCPYELYWFDKTGKFRYTYDIHTVTTMGVKTVSLSDLAFEFAVSGDYAGGQMYTTDAGKIRKASAAVENARKIVEENAGKSDYEKLKAYRDAICELTDYNDEAADEDYEGGYGDPWQMIYVFDGKPETKVVCEGYAKAFQYLCDASTFQRDVTCHSVTGTMSGGTGAGRHMWNLVTLEGKNYLADITNSDAGSAGENGELFLAGAAGSVEEGYVFRSGNQRISYIYDENQVLLYGHGPLTLAEGDYVWTEPSKVTVTEDPEDQVLTYGEGIRTLRVKAEGEGNLSYQWYQDGEPVAGADRESYTPSGLNAGRHLFACEVSCAGDAVMSGEAAVTVNPYPLIPFIDGDTYTKVYDGTDSAPEGLSVVVMKFQGDQIGLDLESFSYNSPDVGTADRITADGITLTGKDAGNYTLEVQSVSAPGKITPRELTLEVSVADKVYDGTKTARIASAVLKGLVAGDDVVLKQGTASFAAAGAGKNIPVHFTEFGISGKDAANYSLVQPEGVTASIGEKKVPSSGTGDGDNSGSTPPGKAALSSVNASGGKKLKLRWKKVAGASGYEVQCCLKKNFKSGVKKASVRKGNKTSLLIGKLKKGKAYYVRIRAYKTVKVNGKSQKLYGAWSKIKRSKKVK